MRHFPYCDDPQLRRVKRLYYTFRTFKCLVAVLLLVALAACATEPRRVSLPPMERPRAPEAPVPEPSPPSREISLLGHTIQVGAFSQLSNAVRLTETLRNKGLDAYYFVHESGLFKVRFGDYPSKEAALVKVEELRSAGIIDEFYVVGPEDYPTAQVRIRGKRYLREQIVKTARTFLGIPYKWGGDSVDEGFDCSGLTMAVYQLNGLNLPRHSRAQWEYGEKVSVSGLEKGDLVFFAIKGGKRINHVGIYLGDGKFIHAPSEGKEIRISSLTNRYFTKRYVGARTYI